MLKQKIKDIFHKDILITDVNEEIIEEDKQTIVTEETVTDSEEE